MEYCLGVVTPHRIYLQAHTTRAAFGEQAGCRRRRMIARMSSSVTRRPSASLSA